MNDTQLKTMLEMQAAMNAKVNPDWRNAGYAWLRAAVIEGAEAIEHHGWKWWKKQEMDKEQFSMELIDIWHFILSHMIVQHSIGPDYIDPPADVIQGQLVSEYLCIGVSLDGEYHQFGKMDTLSRVELLIGLSVCRRVSVPLFKTLMDDVGMNWDELYRQYVGKNVLNFFRQDNGYKQGTYIKIWDDREDNEHLVEIMSTLDAASLTFKDDLYKHLDARYNQKPTLAV